MRNIYRIVIVGASIAGVSAAVALRDNGFAGDITIVDGGIRRPYERPPLSKSLTGGIEPVPIRPDNDYDSLGIDLRLGSEVVSLDRIANEVVLANADRIAADRVVLSTGVSPRRVGVPGEDYSNVRTLRHADDAQAVFHELTGSDGRLVVVGGGFIGLEAAAVARELEREVTVIELGKHPLLHAVGYDYARLLQKIHEGKGVVFRLEQSVARFEGGGTRMDTVVLQDGTRIDASSAIVGTGVVANDELARQAGVICHDGILVDAFGRTSDPWIWAAGDVAVQPHPCLSEPARIEHWDVAMRHGQAVGASLAGNLTSNEEVPYFWSDQYEYTIRMFGRRMPSDTAVLRQADDSPGFVVFWLRDGVISAVAGLDEMRTVRAGKALLERGIAVDPRILVDPNTDLRALARPRVKSS